MALDPNQQATTTAATNAAAATPSANTPTPAGPSSVPGPGTANTPTPTTPTAPGTTSPVKLMDWKSELASGNKDATTRDVKQNELATTHLNEMTQGDSKYIQNARLGAREQASERGMLMSSVAAGAGERAAVDAAQPFAMQAADAYGKTASENMAAQNTDSLADQNLHGSLLGQAVGIKANLDEAQAGRDFTKGENQLNRDFTSNERLAQQDFTTKERIGAQAWQEVENQRSRDLDMAKQEQAQIWQTYENNLQRNFTGTESDKAAMLERFKTFNQSMQQFNNNLSETLSSIYSNPNLKAAEQKAAADNARAVHNSLYQSYAATMSAGVPEIFWQPYKLGT